jgi:hypothetical protein
MQVFESASKIMGLTDSEEPHPGGPAPRRCSVTKFAAQYLMRDPAQDMTSAELWRFYSEIAAAGELEALTRQEFLRALPGAIEVTFGVEKCHAIRRDGQTLRGFKSVTISEETSQK